MPILTMCGLAGGYGKTTTVLACACCAVAHGLNVTILDLDARAAATLSLGMAATDMPLTAEACPVEFARMLQGVCRPGTLRLLRSGRMLAAASAGDVARQISRAADTMDLLIVDTGAELSVATLEALRHSTLALVALRATPLAVGALGDTRRAMSRVNSAGRLRGVLTQVNARRRMVDTVESDLRQRHPGLMYDVRIPDDARCEQATLASMPVPIFAPRSKAAIAYAQLTKDVLHDLGLAGDLNPAPPAMEAANVVA